MEDTTARFKLSEIDTKGVEVFDRLAALHLLDQCGDLARVVFKHSESAQVKEYVKKRFLNVLLEKYTFLSIQDMECESQKLIHLYCNRAGKKLNISTDIDAFSALATKYVDEKNTLLHYDRLYTLFQAVRNVLSFPGDIIELGVYRGGSLKFIREVLDRWGGNQAVYGFDTFTGHTVVTEHDGPVHKEKMFSTGGIEEVAVYIADPRVRLIEGDVSTTIHSYLEKADSVCLAHFDMDVYQPTADALPLVYQKLCPNGIIIFDDYGFTSCPGVKRAVDDFLAITPALHFHLMTGQLILCKTIC